MGSYVPQATNFNDQPEFYGQIIFDKNTPRIQERPAMRKLDKIQVMVPKIFGLSTLKIEEIPFWPNIFQMGMGQTTTRKCMTDQKKKDSWPWMMWKYAIIQQLEYLMAGHQCPRNFLALMDYKLLARWLFQRFYIFTPTIGNDAIWRAYFSDGLKN